MPQVSGERQHVPADMVPFPGTVQQCLNGEAMTQVHQPGSGSLGCGWNSGRLQHFVKGLGHDGVRQPPATPRDEQVRILAGDAQTPLEVLLERLFGTRMQRQQPLLVELGLANHQPIRGDIVQVQARASAVRMPVTASNPNRVL